MKLFYLSLTIFLFAGCAPRHVVYYPTSSPSDNLVKIVRPREEIDGLRYQEQVKAYPIGRYRDPRNSRIMHERHLVYRVEQDSSWDYSPNRSFVVPLGKIEAVSKPNSASSLKFASTEVDIKKQQEHNAALVEQNKVLASKLQNFEQGNQQVSQLTEKNKMLQKQFNQLEAEAGNLKRILEDKSKEPVVIEEHKEKGFIEKLKRFAGLAGQEK